MKYSIEKLRALREQHRVTVIWAVLPDLLDLLEEAEQLALHALEEDCVFVSDMARAFLDKLRKEKE